MEHRVAARRAVAGPANCVSAVAALWFTGLVVGLLGCGDEGGTTDPGAPGAPGAPATAGVQAPAAPAGVNPPPVAEAGAAAPTTQPTLPPAAGSAPQPPAPPVAGMPAVPTPPTPPVGGTAAPPTPGGSDGTPPGELPPELVGTPTLFWLEITSNVVTKAGVDGSGATRFASGRPLSAPDGVAVDPVGGHVFILNMGSVFGGRSNGSLVRYDLDGGNPTVLMPAGSQADGETFNTGKQISIDRANNKLYMGDREGAKVWRCNLDGSELEVLVSGHGIRQVVGVSPDPLARQFYFSDRNGKKLLRASMDMPAGETHATRTDIETLYVDQRPSSMPLDIELDIEGRVVYWTDRQQNSVFSMGMDMPAGADEFTRTDVQTVASGLRDVIGLGYDHDGGMLYATHSGSVSSFPADGSRAPTRIGTNGRTGLAFTKLP